MTKAEEILIDIKFILDMYSAEADTAENTLEKVREILKPVVSLADDQQTVLGWLKEAQSRSVWSSPFGSLYGTIRDHELAIRQLDTKQQFQVLAAFAEWGMSNE